ncbi:hypothetical protein [Alteromonas macleodii]|uniref:Uncharacterized protein n=1 Tax=Alteromonas macleodii TaxID=28108 RepID=A0AB36FND1_ALTMA|nr:hypothetical protein [Alteromonas macleodii]OES24199.1 hypothetical protein BFV93_4799 [Alteromonas macleodii]OES24831.1 hypothetical protein BFV95_4590 [Alteromonas macleodii]OES25109.1 hypothetical protein BFV94_4580 [Alteromonas macleodii]OES39152.1 hypothetical protein BFV96_4300 [Alteromonas macleodii]
MMTNVIHTSSVWAKAFGNAIMVALSKVPDKAQNIIAWSCFALSAVILTYGFVVSSSDLAFKMGRAATGAKTLDVIPFWNITPSDNGFALHAYLAPHENLALAFSKALSVEKSVIVELRIEVNRDTDVGLIEPLIMNSIHRLKHGLPPQIPVRYIERTDVENIRVMGDYRRNHGVAGISPYSNFTRLGLMIGILASAVFIGGDKRNRYRMLLGIGSIGLAIVVNLAIDSWHAQVMSDPGNIYKAVHVDGIISTYQPPIYSEAYR